MDLTESQSLLIGATWQGAETAFGETDFVMLPCGTTEQHSTHLPTLVGPIRAENLTAELATAAPEHDLNPLALPVLPYGYSEYHINYAGMTSSGADTYQEIVIDVGRPVQRHSGTRFLIASFHRGNTGPHRFALDRLQCDHGLDSCHVHWIDFTRDQLEARFDTEWGHVGEYETSVIEYYHPDLVRGDRETPQAKRNRYEVRQYAHFDDPTVEGGLGDPIQSDPEFLEEVIGSATDRTLMRFRSELE